MKTKFLLFALVIFVGGGEVSGQITGSDTVCAGYIYTYKVNMPGAVSFNWTLPNGWYFLSGQGTDSVKVNCNVDTGNVCVIGFDTAANAVDTICMIVYWGGGGSVWQVNLTQTCPPCSPYVLYIQYGGPCSSLGCGNGYQNPNIIFAAFNNQWPNGSFLGVVNGVNTFNGTGQVYVYIVDTTFGINNMILVEGGFSGCSANNSIYLPSISSYLPIQIYQMPDTVCLGDTVIICADLSNYTVNINLTVPFHSDLQIIGGGNNCVTCLITGMGPEIEFDGFDGCNCGYYGHLNVNYKFCNSPNASFIATDSTVCGSGANSCINYFDHSTNNPTSWKWYFPGGIPDSSVQQNPTNICYYAPGTYSVTLIASNIFGSDTLTASAMIAVDSLPIPSIAVIGGDTLVSSHAPFYQWYLNGNPISGGIDSFYVFTQSGTYSVRITDSLGCSNFSNVVLITSIRWFEDDGKIEIYPNPSHNKLTVVFNSTKNENCSVQLCDVMGRVVLEKTFQVYGGENRMELDVAGVAKGIYMLRVGGEIAKVVVE